MADMMRPARCDEIAALSDLAFRSKAYWGYDDAFMEACRGELTVHEADLERFHVFLLEREHAISGFGAVAPGEPEAELWWLFVDPASIGSGAGRTLWQHAVALARSLGVRTLRIESDPNAEGFYLAMGAVRIGEAPSQSIAGRSIPVLEFDLDASYDSREKISDAMNNDPVGRAFGMLYRPEGPHLSDDELRQAIRDAAAQVAAEKDARSLSVMDEPGRVDRALGFLRPLGLPVLTDDELEAAIKEASEDAATSRYRDEPIPHDEDASH